MKSIAFARHVYDKLNLLMGDADEILDKMRSLTGGGTHMYSYEDRLKAVKLYIQYDKSYASVYKELGYSPSFHLIKLWYKEYKSVRGKFTVYI